MSNNNDNTRAETTGTATSRARQVRRAVRRQTRARLALSGPSGAGKTWTALSIAEIIAPGKPIVVIDTEPGDGSQGAAELYADHFTFDTIQWDPPYDPRDLTVTIKELGRDYPGGVLIIDSASHFWRGEGGTLDVADGRFGGWKTATPMQDKMVDAILRSSMHVIVCTRAKQAYAQEQDQNGKQQVRKLGLAPIQRDDLEYEFQVIAMIDTEHRIDIGKTRAQPLSGLSFLANDQERFATIYADWLAGGAELPRQVELDALLAAIKTLDAGPQANLKGNLREQFGPSTAMTAEQMPVVWSAVGAALGIVDHPYAGEAAICATCSLPAVCGWHNPDAPPAQIATAPQDSPQEPPADPAMGQPPAEPSGATEGPTNDDTGDLIPGEPSGDPAEIIPPADADADGPADRARARVADALAAAQGSPPGPDENTASDGDEPWPATDAVHPDLEAYKAELTSWADTLQGKDLQDELDKENLPATGRVAERRQRLVDHLLVAASGPVNPDLAPGTEPF